MSPRKFIGLVYAWLIERTSGENGVEKLDMQLDELLEWQDSSSGAASAIEGESFMAFMAAGGGG